jgi:hypothetical protein
MKIFKSLGKRTIKLAIAGVLLVIVSAIGIWIGNISECIPYTGENRFLNQLGYTQIFSYNYLIAPSVLIGLLGILLFFPAFIQIALRIFKCIWDLIKRGIYEVFYEATRAIASAKKNTKRNETE